MGQAPARSRPPLGGGWCYARAVAITVQLLMSPGCGHGARALELLRQVVAEVVPAATVETLTIATVDDAERQAFPGSPTVRVNGKDIDPHAPRDVGLG
jgi:hypothetical protein